MATPQRHPRTGIFQFRKRVPDHLRDLVGKGEEVRSLNTRDPDEAKRRWVLVAAEVESRWANLAAGPKALSHKDIVAIAGEIYRKEVAAHTDDPGQPQQWRAALQFDDFVTTVRRRTAGKPDPIQLTTGWSGADAILRKRYGARVDGFLAAKGRSGIWRGLQAAGAGRR